MRSACSAEHFLELPSPSPSTASPTGVEAPKHPMPQFPHLCNGGDEASSLRVLSVPWSSFLFRASWSSRRRCSFGSFATLDGDCLAAVCYGPSRKPWLLLCAWSFAGNTKARLAWEDPSNGEVHCHLEVTREHGACVGLAMSC